MCIYCRRAAPEVEPSTAHIFPYVMGGSEATGDTVCLECNRRLNEQVERPAFRSFLPLQSLFGVRGRRGRIPAVRGTLVAEQREVPVYLNERGEIPDAVVIPETNPEGKRSWLIWGPKDVVEAKVREISEKDPTIRWEEAPTPSRAQVFVDFDTNLSAPRFRRLAAKVAFERFAQLYGASYVTQAEFDAVRLFVCAGAEPELCCGVLSDSRYLDGPFHAFAPPHHAVYLVPHPADPVLGGFVILYGLFFYWVILSRRHRALGQLDNLLVQDPQAREATNPVLRGRVGWVRVPWNELIASYLRDPVGAEREAIKYAMRKFQAAADAFYGRDGATS